MVKTIIKALARGTWGTAGIRLGSTLLITLSTLYAAGCTGPRASDAEEKTRPRSASDALLIDSTPFGEMNGDEGYNASGIIPLADSRFLFCDNNAGDALFELDLTPDGRKQGALIRRPLRGLLPNAIDDLEDMALVEEGGRRYIFITSSLYIKKPKEGRTRIPPSGVVRAMINQGGELMCENLPGFRDWLIKAYPQLAASAQATPDEGGINIEGLAWDPGRRALLFGLRTPVPGARPLIIPVKVKDLAGPWATTNLEALEPIQLSIEADGGEQGIRGLCWDQGREAFLVLIGKSVSDSKAPFALYEWKGGAEGKTRRINVAFAKKMKPEGITPGTVGGKRALVIVDDGGGFHVLLDEGRELMSGHI